MTSKLQRDPLRQIPVNCSSASLIIISTRRGQVSTQLREDSTQTINQLSVQIFLAAELQVEKQACWEPLKLDGNKRRKASFSAEGIFTSPGGVWALQERDFIDIVNHVQEWFWPPWTPGIFAEYREASGNFPGVERK